MRIFNIALCAAASCVAAVATINEDGDNTLNPETVVKLFMTNIAGDEIKLKSLPYKAGDVLYAPSWSPLSRDVDSEKQRFDLVGLPLYDKKMWSTKVMVLSGGEECFRRASPVYVSFWDTEANIFLYPLLDNCVCNPLHTNTLGDDYAPPQPAGKLGSGPGLRIHCRPVWQPAPPAETPETGAISSSSSSGSSDFSAGESEPSADLEFSTAAAVQQENQEELTPPATAVTVPFMADDDTQQQQEGERAEEPPVADHEVVRDPAPAEQENTGRGAKVISASAAGDRTVGAAAQGKKDKETGETRRRLRRRKQQQRWMLPWGFGDLDDVDSSDFSQEDVSSQSDYNDYDEDFGIFGFPRWRRSFFPSFARRHSVFDRMFPRMDTSFSSSAKASRNYETSVSARQGDWRSKRPNYAPSKRPMKASEYVRSAWRVAEAQGKSSSTQANAAAVHLVPEVVNYQWITALPSSLTTYARSPQASLVLEEAVQCAAQKPQALEKLQLVLQGEHGKCSMHLEGDCSCWSKKMHGEKTLHKVRCDYLRLWRVQWKGDRSADKLCRDLITKVRKWDVELLPGEIERRTAKSQQLGGAARGPQKNGQKNEAKGDTLTAAGDYMNREMAQPMEWTQMNSATSESNDDNEDPYGADYKAEERDAAAADQNERR